MKKVLLIIALLISGLGLNAQDATIGDLEFTVTSETPAECAVSGYSGEPVNVIIPSTVTISGKEYTVTSIGDYAFSWCSSLTSIEIPSGVTSIGKSAFNECSSLTSVTFGENSKLTSIGNYAFESCSSLTSIDFGENSQLTSIGASTFYFCSSLTSIELPSGVTSIGSYAFSYCDNLTSIVVESGNTVYDSRDNCNAIIETATNTLIAGCQNTVIPSSVTSIGAGAFSGCSSLTSIELPSGVTSIGENAFSGCSSLTSIELPSGVTSIGENAFYDCSSLTSIELPSGVTSIGNYAFESCSSLTSIIVESGNTVYDSRDNCNAIIETATNTLIAGCQNTVIPSSVTSIGAWAFSGCSSLTSIDFGENSQLTSIGEAAFSYCSSLTSIELPSGVTSIGNSAFYYCFSLTSIEFGENSQLTSIGDNAFYGCSSLTSIELPSGVTSIGYGAFNYCSSLTSIELPSGVTSIGMWTFSDCSSLTSIEIPSGVTSIGAGAFYDCSSLTSIEIPSGVTSIGDNAFSGCSSLTSIEIPSGVTSIGDNAFRGCSSLTSIYCYAETVPETSYSAFTSCNLKMVIYVPIQSVDAYETTVPWNNYTIMPLSYIVAAAANPEEAGVITGTGEYELSDTVTLTATANEGYRFVSWTENNNLVSIDKEYSFVVANHRNLVANFEKTYEITATVNPEKVGVVMGKGVYSHGDNVTLVAIPVKTGYEFVNWTEDGEVVSEDVEYSFVATSDRDLVANFVLLDYYVSAVANAAEAGEILGSGNYNHGEDVTLTAVANEGYKFVSWTEDGEVISSVEEYSFVIIKDRNLVANFEKLEDPEEPADTTTLAAPTNLRAAIRQDIPGYNYKFEITMMWDAVDGAKGYDIYVNTADTIGFYMGYTNGTAYVAGTNNEGTLEFYVVAFNDSIESAPSETYTITIVDDAIEELEASFNIYPNPVNDKLYIETLTQTQTLTVEIYDVYGRRQSMVNGQQSTVIDVTDLNSGVYFVKVVTSEGEAVKRFIKK